MRTLGRRLRLRRSRPPLTRCEPARHLDADRRRCSLIDLGVCFQTMVKSGRPFTPYPLFDANQNSLERVSRPALSDQRERCPC
jgi:hypothetical protein